MDQQRTRLYIARAVDFYSGMELTQNDVGLQATAALLAIHSAIAFSDALRTGLGDLKLHADNHQQAVSAIKSLLRDSGVSDESGIRNFEYLISMKTFVAYRAERLDGKRASLITVSAERFAKLVNKVATLKNIEGWKDGDY